MQKAKAKAKALSLSEDSPVGGERRPKAEPPWRPLICTHTLLDLDLGFKKLESNTLEKENTRTTVMTNLYFVLHQIVITRNNTRSTVITSSLCSRFCSSVSCALSRCNRLEDPFSKLLLHFLRQLSRSCATSRHRPLLPCVK